MSYYDNVKNSVKDGDTSKPNFETLRKAAQETSEEEDEQTGDDTEIEVLDENGLNKTSSSSQSQSQSGSNSINSGSAQSSPAGQSGGSTNADLSGVEEKLDTIIEQNERMIEILESFGS